VIGALGALQARHQTGKGCVIDTALFDSAVAWVEGPLNGYNHTGKPPQRFGGASFTLVPYQVFETSDRPICIAAGNDRLFVKCANVLGHPEWASDPRFIKVRDRAANRHALIELMKPVLKTRGRAEWMAGLEKAGVPCSPVNDIPELSQSEQLKAADLLRNLPGTELNVVGLPIVFDGVRPYPRSDAPKLGQHNDEVLSERRATAAE
jgi:formyl-CoA transferase